MMPHWESVFGGASGSRSSCELGLLLLGNLAPSKKGLVHLRPTSTMEGSTQEAGAASLWGSGLRGVGGVGFQTCRAI